MPVLQVAGTLEPTWELGIYNTGGASAVVADVSTLVLPAGLVVFRGSSLPARPCCIPWSGS
jgi:hypothetical protein